ncbi:MAG: hypothetical protein DRJ08_07285, partial [Acidobacteria bacterium]
KNHVLKISPLRFCKKRWRHVTPWYMYVNKPEKKVTSDDVKQFTSENPFLLLESKQDKAPRKGCIRCVTKLAPYKSTFF